MWASWRFIILPQKTKQFLPCSCIIRRKKRKQIWAFIYRQCKNNSWQALKFDASAWGWFALGFAKTIPGEFFQIHVEVLSGSHHQMIIFIIIRILHINNTFIFHFFWETESFKEIHILVVKPCSVLPYTVYVWMPLVFPNKVKKPVTK